MSPDNHPMGADAISKPGAGSPHAAVTAALKRAGAATGASFELLYNMARRESSFDPAAKAKTSSAAGLFQFIEQTWLGAVKAYGARHGLADAAAAVERSANGRFTVSDPARRQEILNLRFNAEHAAALAGELVQENRAALEKSLGRAVSSAELYAAHFLGAAGAAKLLTAPAEASAAALLPNAAAANRSVFYDKGRERRVGEVILSIEKSMRIATPAPEQKSARISAAFASFPDAVSAFEIETPLRAGGSPAERAESSSLTRLFGWRGETAPTALSPLALAVLEALDPRRLLRNEEQTSR